MTVGDRDGERLGEEVDCKALLSQVTTDLQCSDRRPGHLFGYLLIGNHCHVDLCCHAGGG